MEPLPALPPPEPEAILPIGRPGAQLPLEPVVRRGQVTLRTPSGIPDHELWPLTNRLLASRGLGKACAVACT